MSKCSVCKEAKSYFGYVRNKPTHCSLCKTSDMVDVFHKMCVKCNKVSPSFGYNKGNCTHCSACKEPDMKNVRYKLCKKCDKYPTFGYTQKNPTHCGTCKEPDMVDVRNSKKLCLKCKKTRANQGFILGKPTHCNSCKESGMKNVTSKKCEICHEIQPSYGYKKATHCAQCKAVDMLDFINQKCIVCCKKYPSYGLEKRKATHCADCKEPNMTNVVNEKCVANQPPYNIICTAWKNRKYNGFCANCFAHLFPDHPKTLTIRKKSKELKVISYISSKHEGFIHNKPLYVDLNGSDCPSKRRIDLRKLINGTLLCIEVDEEQRSYHLEEGRYHDLFMDFSGKYIFIRYNPDAYRDTKGKKRNPQFNTRMKILEEQILLHTNRINSDKNEDLLEIHYLFYNEDKQPVLHSKNLSCLEE